MKALLITILTVFAIGSTIAQSNFEKEVKRAISAYKAEDYKTCIEAYKQIETTGNHSFEMYYNMGNSYYKLNDMASALLYYERAKKLKPNDEDLVFNIVLARSKVVDKVNAIPELEVTKAYKSFLHTLSVDGWAVISILLFFTGLSGLFIMLYFQKIAVKRLGLIVGAAALVLSLLSHLFAGQVLSQQQENVQAIVFTPSVIVKSTPGAGGTELFVIHEGLKVNVLEESEDWVKIKLEDGNVGWLQTEHITKI